jgi:uncharacterized protein YlxW (UPF0749 family)
MSLDDLRQNWGLAVAGLLMLIVLAIVLVAIYRRSARGQLAATVRALRQARRECRQTEGRVAALTAKVAKLRERARSVKPRVLTETSEALDDARALAKIHQDRVLVAANHVRRVIYQEYPPAKHEALRQKYLPDDKPATGPFSF